MPRPTPARILYLLVGLVLGLAAMVGVQSYLLPSLSASLPFGFGTAPPPAAPAGPSQFTGGALERVQAVNLAQDRGGVAIRVNSLELYKDGLIFTYALRGGTPDARAGDLPDLRRSRHRLLPQPARHRCHDVGRADDRHGVVHAGAAGRGARAARRRPERARDRPARPGGAVARRGRSLGVPDPDPALGGYLTVRKQAWRT
jgi:hypothetical protein